MAEFVERRVQEMLPIIEKLKQTKLFKEPKLKIIIGKIREHEFKIQRPARTFEDFMKYLNYLKKILLIVGVRREKYGYWFQKSEIEDRIMGLIAARFGMANHNFKHDMKFWTYRINFMKEMNRLDHVSGLFTEVTKLHGKSHPELWVDASNFEWKRRPGPGIEPARLFIQLGLRSNPTLPILYIQAFVLELRYVAFAHKNHGFMKKVLNSESGDNIVYKLALAKAYYNQAKANCPRCPDLLLKFYVETKGVPFAKELSDQILSDLRTEYPDHEQTWDILAKVVLTQDDGKLHGSNLRKGIAIYNEGLTAKPTVEMYELFGKTLEYLHNISKHPALKEKIISEQLSLYDKGHRNMKLFENAYFRWYGLATGIESGRIKKFTKSTNDWTHPSSETILGYGIERFPKSWNLLSQRIGSHLESPNLNFKEIVDKKGQIMSDLRSMEAPAGFEGIAIHVHVLLRLLTGQLPKKSQGAIEKFILDKWDPKVSIQLRLIYLKHLSFKGIEPTRAFYNKASQLEPQSLELYLLMAQIELLHIRNKKDSLTQAHEQAKLCFEKAVVYFGSSHIELWTKYLTFSRKVLQDGKFSAQIYERALNTLDPGLKEGFISSERPSSSSGGPSTSASTSTSTSNPNLNGDLPLKKKKLKRKQKQVGNVVPLIKKRKKLIEIENNAY